MQVKVMSTTVDYSIVNAADTSQTLTVFTTTPNIYIMDFFARVKTAFSGVTRPKVSLGVAGHTQFYVPTQNIGTVGDLLTGACRDTANICTKIRSFQKTPANVPILATFSSTSGNLSSLSAGVIEFVCVYVE